jgi:DNA polymerase III delta prime subunit
MNKVWLFNYSSIYYNKLISYMFNKKHTLFTEKYRPDILEGYIGNDDFKSSLQQWIDTNDIPHLLLCGGAGTGKTTAAKLIVNNINCDYVYINCSDENGIDTIRDKVKSFASAASFKPQKVVIMDEADFLTINAQAALRNIIETFSLTTRFIFTCNYVERIIDPIQSRTIIFELTPPSMQDVAFKCVEILDLEGVTYTKADIVRIVKQTYPDIRKSLNLLQSSIKDGNLQQSREVTNFNQTSDQIITLLKGQNIKNFTIIRQLVMDSNIRDYNELYRVLFERADEFTNSAIASLIIADYQYKSLMAPDKEITFMGAIAKLLTTK